jgi:hypothetical protein
LSEEVGYSHFGHVDHSTNQFKVTKFFRIPMAQENVTGKVCKHPCQYLLHPRSSTIQGVYDFGFEHASTRIIMFLMHLDGKEGLINRKEQNVIIKCCENYHAQ